MCFISLYLHENVFNPTASPLLENSDLRKHKKPATLIIPKIQIYDKYQMEISAFCNKMDMFSYAICTKNVHISWGTLRREVLARFAKK